MKIIINLKTLAGIIFLGALLSASPTFSQGYAKLTDPEIASVVVVANQVDIDYAELAKKKSKDAEILKFAETMATDHKAVLDQAVALVTKLKVTPKENMISQLLQDGAKQTKKVLNGKSGQSFDKAYIDNEVAYHKGVIALVESRLIPEASNQELKDLLQNVLPAFKAHLGHAEMVQKRFTK